MRVEHCIVTYEDAEIIREHLLYTKKQFCSLLGVSCMQYWRWKNNGVSETAQQLLRILEKRPDVVVAILIDHQQ